MDTPAVVSYRYPPNQLVGDYIRSLCGVAFSGGILLFTAPAFWVQIIFLIIFGIFFFFGLRTYIQHKTTVELSEEGVALSTPLTSKKLAWSEMKSLRLRFFGSRRQRKQQQGGFLQLDLRGANQKLSFESSLDGFRDLAWCAAKAARENFADSDPTTASNLLAMGVSLEDETPRPVGEGY
ncbi:hypothetical protein ACTL6U_12405 [Rhodovibrionaceae bacterium A322]